MTEEAFKTYASLNTRVKMNRIKLDLLDEVVSLTDPWIKLEIFPSYRDLVDHTDAITFSSNMDCLPVEPIIECLRQSRDALIKEIDDLEKEMLAL